MKTAWALQDAKNRFSEVVNQALSEGPQVITRHGKDTAVVLSVEDFQQLAKPRGTLAKFFRTSPLVSAKLDLGRAADTGRGIDL